MRRARRRPQPGFTLIELMIIVAVIGILMLIALPKFSNTIRKANEAGTKGHLGSIRGAIRLYYMDNDQFFPPVFSALRSGGAKYLSGVTPLYTGVHPTVETVDDVPLFGPVSDVGHWAYVTGGTDLGYFWIRCVHSDSSGQPWSRF